MKYFKLTRISEDEYIENMGEPWGCDSESGVENNAVYIAMSDEHYGDLDIFEDQYNELEEEHGKV